MKLFIDSLRRVVPKWMIDRVQQGKTVGFRYLYAMVALADIGVEVLVQGTQMRWPGVVLTPDSQAATGRSRGIMKPMGATPTEYGANLKVWRDRWKRAGSQEAIARALHDYIAGRPQVRVFNRAGVVVTITEAGVLSTTTCAWDWDSKSNPEKATHWSELWVVIYPPSSGAASPFPRQGPVALKIPNLGDGAHLGAITTGLGHLVGRTDADAVKQLLSQWKSAHARINCVIWTYDFTLFDPSAGTLPDGFQGRWWKRNSSGVYVEARNPLCRYWEPNPMKASLS